MKIEIKGAYGETNFGDDLLMCVFENFFSTQLPNARLNFVGENENYVLKLLRNSGYREPKFKPDIIVYGGGTQFFSFSSPKKLSFGQKAIKILKNPYIILQKVFPKSDEGRCFVPTAFLGFGIGPFYVNGPVVQRAQIALKNAVFVGVRDEVSFSYCESWGVKAYLGADVVFSSYFQLPKLPKIQNIKKKIGIIVRDWDWESTGADYINVLKKVCGQGQHEYDFQFIVFAPLKDKQWIESIGIEELLVWDPEKYSVNEFLNSLNQFDAFISARYHGAIVASLLNKPVICIEVEDKLKILTDQLHELKLWRKPFNEEELLNHLITLNFNIEYSDSKNILSMRANHMLNSFHDFISSLTVNT